MTIASDSMSGKFYRFKPHKEWPIDSQTTIAQDRMYYIHPVIVLSSTSSTPTHVYVVTITSSPKLSEAAYNYVPIGFQCPLSAHCSEALKIVGKKKLAKVSWVKLDSRGTFDPQLLVPFVDGSGSQYQLKAQSTKRLVKLVQEYEERTMAESVARNLLETGSSTKKSTETKTTSITSAQSSTYEQAHNPSQLQLEQIRATLVSLQLEATENKSQLLHLADINTSLASLKEAIACVKSRTPKPSQEKTLVLKTGGATVTIMGQPEGVKIDIPSPGGSMKEDNAYRDYLRTQRHKIRSQMYGNREAVVHENESTELEGVGEAMVAWRSRFWRWFGRWFRRLTCLGEED